MMNVINEKMNNVNEIMKTSKSFEWLLDAFSYESVNIYMKPQQKIIHESFMFILICDW